jgi:DnaJ-class molecular chaperone
MICPNCQGKGETYKGLFNLPTVCPECFGAGFVNCCEGLREQPEPPEDEEKTP